MTTIWATVAAGRLRETASLLQRGGEEERRNLHRVDMNGDHLLLLAVRSSNPELVQLLLEYGSQPDMRNRKTGCGALHEAVRLQSGVDALRILDTLVEHRAYVNLRDKQGQTPLHIATELAFEEAIDYLLAVGANPSFKDRKGRKPAQIAKANTDSTIYEAFFNLDFKMEQERKQKGKRKGGVRRKKDPNQRLYKAILLNRLKELEGLLKAGEKGGIRVNGASHRGHSPIYLASKLGHLDTLNMLIKYGAKPYIMNTCGTTALHAAAEGGHDTVIEVLLAHGAPMDVRDNEKKTALDLAFQKGKGSTTRLLLNRILSQGQTFSQKRWDWMFRKAAKSGQVDLMQLVMKCSKSLNINTQTLSGWAPLHIAVRHGQMEAITFLLAQRGIKTNLGTEANWTPLHVACDNPDLKKKLKLMSLLLSQKGTNPNIQNSSGFTPLHMCTKKHDLEGVRLLLEYNADPDIKDQKGWTPLSIAYSEKQQKMKLQMSAASDEGSGGGLEVEVEGGEMDAEEEVMHCLIEAGADPNQLSFTSRTSPLFEACRLGMERRAEVLIEHGADVNFVMPARKAKKQRASAAGVDDEEEGEQDAEREEEMTQAWSVLGVSVLKERSPRIITLLVEQGAFLDFTNAKGYTPLHTAVTLANYEVVKILLEAGANPNIANVDGNTPLHTAFCVAFADKASLGVPDDPHAVAMSRRRRAEKIVEELLVHAAEPGAGKSRIGMLKTALYGNNPAILASLLKLRPNGVSVGTSVGGLLDDANDLLPYLLNMRRRPTTQVGDLKELLALFIDGEAEDEAIPYRVDINGVKAGRTSVHDLVLSSVFTVANAPADDLQSASTRRMLACERELLEFLVAKGAVLNQPDENTGFTPLISAVLALGLVRGHDAVYRNMILDIIDHLLALGAAPSLSMGDKYGRTWLHHAAQVVDEESLGKLLALATKHVGAAAVKGLIDARDVKGRHALHAALIKGHLPSVSCLLQHGADASFSDRKGWSSVHLALMVKDKTTDQLWELVRELAEHGADINATSDAGFTVLDMAVKNGKWKLAQRFAEMGSTFSASDKLVKMSSRLRWPLLHTIAEKGYCKLAEMLLEAGCVDINAMDRHMWTAVHVAVLQADVNMTRLLLDAGADPSQGTNHAWSVLHTAAALRRAKTTEERTWKQREKLRKDRRDLRKKEQQMKAAWAAASAAASGTPVPPAGERPPRLTRKEFEAAELKRKEEKVQEIEEENRADSCALTNEEVSAELLSLLCGHRGVNFKAKDERGRTALDVALLVGNIKGARVLAAHGAKKSKFGAPNGKGWTDLHRAVFDGELRTVKDILKVMSVPDFCGLIDVNGLDKAGLSPLLLAVRKPNARVVKELLDHGADPAITDRKGWNCLHHALRRKRRAVVKVLMKYVGDDVVYATTCEGYTCLDLASTQGSAKRSTLHDLVSRNYKKLAVAERPENRPEDRSKKVKDGHERTVVDDTVGWGGQKRGNTVDIDLREDWLDWQYEYECEQDEYDAELEAQYAEEGEEGEDHHYNRPRGGAFLDWSEYLPQEIYPYPLSVPYGQGEVEGDQPLEAAPYYDDYPVVHDPSFTYPPGYPAEEADLGAGGDASWEPPMEPQEEEYPPQQWHEWSEPAESGVADWSGNMEASAGWSDPSSYYPGSGDWAPAPSLCPFCGSVWADSGSVIAHALAAHNAHLG